MHRIQPARVAGQQAPVVPTGFSVFRRAESRLGVMTGDFGELPIDRTGKSPALLALLKEIELKIDEIKTIEKRLGTPAELPPDLDRARELAHRINNLLTTFRLGSDLSSGGSET